jgi:hypothetical protein
MGKQPMAGVVANAKDLSFRAQAALQRVVEDIAFKAAARDETEAERGQLALEIHRIGDAELDLGFNGHRKD